MSALTWMQEHTTFLWMERLSDFSGILVIFSTYFLQNNNHKGIESDSVAQP